MSYPCQVCGRHTITQDTRGNIRTRKCSQKHRHFSIEIPLGTYQEEQEELYYLRALKLVVNPTLDTSQIEFSPELNCRKQLPNKHKLTGITQKPNHNFHARVYFQKERITVYHGPDFFEAACRILSWKNKHDYHR